MTSTTVKPSTRGGCIGFCRGGRYTVLMAVSSDHLERPHTLTGSRSRPS